MQIIILGKGNMGRPIAALAENAGHGVEIYGREGAAPETLARADIIIIATKYEQALEVVANPAIARALSGKVVIDLTNPLAPDFMSLTVGHTSSAAEEIARALPGARVVKAFNTVFATVIALRAEGQKITVPVFVAGDDESAVGTVIALVQDFGFETIFAGALTNARYLESMTEQLIQLGYGLGHGDRIGFAMVKAM